jgi:hypothetical protein
MFVLREKGMQIPAVGIEEGHDVERHSLSIEGLSILEVLLPNLIDDVAEEFGGPTHGCLVTSVVIKAGFVGSLCTYSDHHGSVVGNILVVEGEAGRAYKCCIAVVGFVLDSLHEDGGEGVLPGQLIIGDTISSKKRVYQIASRLLLVSFPLMGREESCLLEEECDCIGHHAYSWAGGVFFLPFKARRGP